MMTLRASDGLLEGCDETDVVVVLGCAACGQGAGSAPSAPDAPSPSPLVACGAGAAVTGKLGSDDSVDLTCTQTTQSAQTAAGRVAPRSETIFDVDISAPIWPKLDALPSDYPAIVAGDDGVAAEQDMARMISVSFGELFAECAPMYPDITPWKPGDPPLTEAQARTNYEDVVDCGYNLYKVKPYWIPKLIEDVDVCQIVLGGMWRTPTTADLAALGPDARQAIVDTMTFGAAPQGIDFWGAFYVLDPKQGVVAGGVGADGVTLSPIAGDLSQPIEDHTIVRCIRGHAE